MAAFWQLLVLANCLTGLLTNGQVPDSTVQSTPATPNNATYLVTVSRSFRAGQRLPVSVQILKGSKPVSVTVVITRESYAYQNNTARVVVSAPATEVLPAEPRIIQVEIPLSLKQTTDNVWWRYKIRVEGRGQQVNFKHEDYLNLQSKAFSLFLVTDKAFYKPGQTVKFRALAVSADNLRTLTYPISVFVSDSKGNKIRQFLALKQQEGVAEDSFQLAKSTPLGVWTITAEVEGLTESRTFTVDQYVLPKYEVKIKTPAIVLSSSPSYSFTVSAKYTFGQPVTAGRVDVLLKNIYGVFEFNRVVYPLLFTTSGQLNKDGEFTFDITNKQLLTSMMTQLKYVTSLDYAYVTIEANVTEPSSQRTMSASSSFNIYPSPLTIEFPPICPQSFKPGLPYTAYLQIQKVDGSLFSPEEAKDLKVWVNVTYEVVLPPENNTNGDVTNSTDDTYPELVDNTDAVPGLMAKRLAVPIGGFVPWKRTTTKVLQSTVLVVPASGFIPVHVQVPTEASSINIIATAEAPNSGQASLYVQRADSPSNTYLQLSAPPTRPKVGDKVTFNVLSTEPIKTFTYQVLSRGALLVTNTVSSPAVAGSTSQDFDVLMTASMTPLVKVLVFFIRNDSSEVVADALSISVDGLFETQVTIEASTERVKPGESLNILIQAYPNSVVFYGGVDESVYLLGANNDLTSDRVRDELAMYSDGGHFTGFQFMFRCGWPYSFGAADTESVLQAANTIMFTDAFIYSKQNDYPLPESKNAINNVEPAFLRTGDDAAAGSMKAPERTRTNFQDSWLWGVRFVSPGSSGQVEVQVTSPDTITSWRLNVFSVHPVYGLSVASSTKVTTYRDMFVSLDLPSTAKRSEELCVAVSLFNYYPSEGIPVLVTLESSEFYQGTYLRRQGETVTKVAENSACADLHFDVMKNEVRNSKFCFTPVITGEIPVRVTALTTVDGLSDAVEQNITVKPEGVARFINFPNLVNLTTGSWEKTIQVNFPLETVADSQSIVVSITGDMIGSLAEQVDTLLRQPYGCGEQNMLNFAPNIYLLKFLFSTKTIQPEFLERAVGYMASGYQTQLTYEHGMTGSYSAFGSRDASGSMWLTSFVLRCYSQADVLDAENDHFLGINFTEAIIRSVNYIISNQNKNGSFSEFGIVFHKEMQGGSAGGEALTAYVLVSLAEASIVLRTNNQIYRQLRASMTLSADYLATRFYSLTDPYDISLVTYALHLVNHKSKEQMFAKLEQIAITGDGFKYWERAKSRQERSDPQGWETSADSLSIEMTAYALLTYALRGVGTTLGLPVIRWLTNQRGPNGGFVSTQDTVVGLQALTSAFIPMHSNQDSPIEVRLSYLDYMDAQQVTTVHINQENKQLLHNFYIPVMNNKPSNITISARTDNGQPGPSTVFLDITQNFNIKEAPLLDWYQMSHVLKERADGLDLTIYVKSNESSGMSLLNVEVPAGYSADNEALIKNPVVSRADSTQDDQLDIYFDTGVIDNKGINVTIEMYKTGSVLAKAAPRSYTCSDYYQPYRRHTETYMLTSAPFCQQVPEVGICPYLQ